MALNGGSIAILFFLGCFLSLAIFTIPIYGLFGLLIAIPIYLSYVKKLKDMKEELLENNNAYRNPYVKYSY